MPLWYLICSCLYVEFACLTLGLPILMETLIEFGSFPKRIDPAHRRTLGEILRARSEGLGGSFPTIVSC